MKKFFSFFAALLFAGSMMATEVVFTNADFAGQGTANTGSEVTATKDGVTFTYSKGYSADESLRCYAHGALEIESESTITKINFTTTGGKTGGLDAEVEVNATKYEVADMASQARFTEIKVTLADGGEVPPTPSVATPVISGDEEFTDSVIVTITCSTPETDIYYTTDGTTDPKCDCAAAPEYTHEIVLKETTTIMAAAYTGNDWSAVATKTFTKKEPLVAISCAAVYELADNAELALNPVVVTYSNGANVWVKDETGSMLVYLPQNFNNEYVAGDILDGIQGTKATYKGLVEVKPTLDQMAAVAVTKGEAPAPEELAVVSDADVNKYILIKGVSAEGAFAEGTASNINITLGNASYVLRNNFKNGYTFEAGKTYDVVALVSYYNALQLYFVSAEEAGAPEVEAIVYNWADNIGTTIFGGNSNITTGTIKIHENTDDVNGIKFGSSYVYADGKWVAIKPVEGGFKAGDEIRLSVVFNNSDLTKYCMADVYAADQATRLFRSDSLSTLNGRNAGEPAIQTYTLAADQDSLFLGRYGNTTMFVTFLQVARSEEVVPPTPPTPVVLDTLTVAQAIEIGMALDSAATSELEYVVEGYVINAGAFSQLYHNQSWYMADEAGASASDFQAYNCYPLEGEDTLKVLNGDKVSLVGKLKKYYNRNTSAYIIEIEKGDAHFISKVDGDHSTAVETETITVAQALEIGAALADGAVTEKQYKITGYVSAINVKSSDAYSDQYKNQSFWVADDASSTASTNADGAFYVYRGKPDTEAEIPVGSKVEFTCTIKKYVPSAGGDVVIENADQNIVVKVLEPGVLEFDTLNVTDAYAAAQALEQNTESPIIGILGYVAKIKTEYNEKYGNISFYMTDDKTSEYGDLQVYQGKISKEEGEALAHGDLVLVVGKLKHTYNQQQDKDYYEVAAGSSVSVLSKQAIENIVLTEKVNKVLMDGVIYIVRDGKLYNLQGAQVR